MYILAMILYVLSLADTFDPEFDVLIIHIAAGIYCVTINVSRGSKRAVFDVKKLWTLSTLSKLRNMSAPWARLLTIPTFIKLQTLKGNS